MSPPIRQDCLALSFVTTNSGRTGAPPARHWSGIGRISRGDRYFTPTLFPSAIICSVVSTSG